MQLKSQNLVFTKTARKGWVHFIRTTRRSLKIALYQMKSCIVDKITVRDKGQFTISRTQKDSKDLNNNRAEQQ